MFVIVVVGSASYLIRLARCKISSTSCFCMYVRGDDIGRHAYEYSDDQHTCMYEERLDIIDKIINDVPLLPQQLMQERKQYVWQQSH